MTAPASVFRNIKPISEILIPGELRGQIDEWIAKKTIPNLFFYGPPGTGKTSTILSICGAIFPRDILTECVFLCNFSYNRGIKFIRDKVRQISSWAIPIRHDIPRYKVIILDEIDCITSEAQAALNAIMSEFDTTVRFCLLCNNANKINPGLVMSCVQIGFYHNNPDIIIAIIDQLQRKYDVKLSDSNKRLLINYFQSDIRKMEQLMSVFPLLTTVDDKLSREINIAPIDFFRDIANVSEITTANIMRRIICEARSSFNVWSSYRIYCDMYLKSEIDSEKKAILEDVIIDYWLRVQSGIDDKILTLWLISQIRQAFIKLGDIFPFIESQISIMNDMDYTQSKIDEIDVQSVIKPIAKSRRKTTTITTMSSSDSPAIPKAKPVSQRRKQPVQSTQ